MFEGLKKFSHRLNENFHIHDTRGMISIIAIAIFALLMIFGLMLQQTVVDTYQSVKGMNNYYIARDISDSTMEYLQYKLNNYEPGYNEEVECVYTNGTFASATPPVDTITETECRSMEGIIQGENVVIKWVVKGRADTDEKLAIGTTTNCGANMSDKISSDSCYVVPFPGTGSAGKHCDLYYPDFYDDADGDGNTIPLVEAFLTGGDDDVDQLDYSCNWNKLIFGSSQTDRVSIPFYYDDNGDETMVNTFTTTGGGNRFYLRLRTPCLPCVYETQDVVSGGNRFCNSGEDPTVCGAGERYVLDAEGGNGDIVVQWQLTGQCLVDGVMEECGLVPIPEYNEYSAIFEGQINNETDRNRILKKEREGYRTDTNENVKMTFSSRLSSMTTPTLTLFLNSALISTEGKNIPYLEYQILTDKPIGNPKTKMEVIANVDGNVFWKILYKEEAKGLIDFAVQN